MAGEGIGGVGEGGGGSYTNFPSDLVEVKRDLVLEGMLKTERSNSSVQLKMVSSRSGNP